MAHPTTLSPWYVVQKLKQAEYHDDVAEILYYAAPEEGVTGLFTDLRSRALIFTSIQSASRVAAAEGAEVRVLTTKEESAEFGRN